MTNKTLKLSVIIVGIYASVLSLLHGIFEMAQGSVKIDAILIYAISREGQVGEMWHGNFPAMTILPNFFISGLLVSLISLGSIFYLLRTASYSRLILLGLSFALLLFGGGFVPFFLLLMTTLASLWIDKNIRHPQAASYHWMRVIWQLSIIVLIVWSILEWILGFYINPFLVSIGTALFLFGIILPLFILFMGAMNDRFNLAP